MQAINDTCVVLMDHPLSFGNQLTGVAHSLLSLDTQRRRSAGVRLRAIGCNGLFGKPAPNALTNLLEFLLLRLEIYVEIRANSLCPHPHLPASKAKQERAGRDVNNSQPEIRKYRFAYKLIYGDGIRDKENKNDEGLEQPFLCIGDLIYASLQRIALLRNRRTITFSRLMSTNSLL